MAKSRGLLARILLVVHLASWASGEVHDACRISARSMTRALCLLEDYLIPMWRRTLAAFGGAAEINGARRIARYIRSKPRETIRVADITKLNWTGLKDRSAVMAAFDVLSAHDWLGEPERRPGVAGRPSASYRVNPLIYQFGALDV
jgi:hypothetical protein